jgi:hypothetical protein
MGEVVSFDVATPPPLGISCLSGHRLVGSVCQCVDRVGAVNVQQCSTQWILGEWCLLYPSVCRWRAGVGHVFVSFGEAVGFLLVKQWAALLMQPVHDVG